MTEYAELIWDENEEERSVFLEQLAPIVLFTYNRLEHTKRTIEALQQNIYAADSHLIIFSDGSKNSKITKSVIAVREYLSTIKGFKSIKIIERNDNWGLAKNIIDGVTSIINQYGKIIVLEDDIVTSRYFLKYMNDALKIYEDYEEIMAVSGYSYTEGRAVFPETYFLPFPSSWGWATWKRTWDKFERNPSWVIENYTKDDIYRFNINNTYDFWKQIVSNLKGESDTWAVFFYETIFRNQGMCVFPKYSLVNNIGFDGSGENCENDKNISFIINHYVVKKFNLERRISQKALQDFQRKMKNHHTIMKKCYHKILTEWHRIFLSNS